MRLSHQQIETMIGHARLALPHEACGLLAGRDGVATFVHCLENARHSPDSYELAADGYRLLIALEEAGELLAAFHSHTCSPAYPSPTDRRWALWPVPYVIISLADINRPVVRAFRIVKRDPLDLEELGEVVEEPLEIV